MANYPRNWFDTRDNILSILKADEFLTQLVFRNLNIRQLNEANASIVIAAITIFNTARYPAHGRPHKTREYIDSLVVGEMMAPVIPVANVLDQLNARTEFVFVMHHLIGNPTVHNRNKGYDAWIQAVNEVNAGLEEEARQQIVQAEDMAEVEYAEYLIWLALGLSPSMYMSPVQLVVASYVGIAKRGTMSDAFVNKIQTGIKDELGVDLTLDTDMIKCTYVNFGKYVTAVNAADVFEAWLADIPEHALRLRLSLEQVSGSGLTAYIVIGRCMRKYRDFPWDRLNVITDGEVERYLAATRTVDGNMYIWGN